MNKKSKSLIDIYLSQLPDPQKSTLTKMRKWIVDILPQSTECISYGLPAFKLNGTVVGGFAAGKKNCSYYPFSGRTLKTLKSHLTKYKKTKSALHFAFDKPLSKKTMNLLLLTRITEIQPKRQKSRIIQAGGVEKYIFQCPKEIREKLHDLRAAIQEIAPDAVETVSYFDMPGYSYEGYEYNGMFAWFSFKWPFIRLHLRPAVLVKHKKALEKFVQSKAIVCFPLEKPIPKALVKKLIKSSLKEMQDLGKKRKAKSL
jgi:uncharacterized protein YdhG (YjbR/CyaY superfamily)